MKKTIAIVVGLVVSGPVWLQAELTHEQVVNLASGDFEREWDAHGYPYTIKQIEASVDRLVAAVSQPAYIERVVSLINDVEIQEAGQAYDAAAWNKVLPLEYLTSEDISMLHHFFYLHKQMIPLKNAEYLLAAQLHACRAKNTQPDPATVALLVKVRKEFETLSHGIMLGALAEIAVFHAMGLLTSEVLEQLNANSVRFSLKWTPLFLASSEIHYPGIVDMQELTKEERARLFLIVGMVEMTRTMCVSAGSYEQYQEIAAWLSDQLDDALAAINTYRNQQQVV